MRKFRELLRSFRGFLTIPAAISLSGLVVAGLIAIVEHTLVAAGWPVPTFAVIPKDTASDVLGTIAGASMSALVMVYSIVLLVYTLAAGSIGPRLLQRFGEDRVNQIAVGSLGATFLYSLFAMWLIREGVSVNLAVVVGLVYSVVSVLLLLLFVQTVSTRVSIDQEAARISQALDDQIDDALASSAEFHSQDIVLPPGKEHPVTSDSTGYVNSIEADALVRAAEEADAVVVFLMQPGDFMMETDTMAHVIGRADEELETLVRNAAPLIPARDPNGDIRFSVHLLVEIALRALSPGVNDTFTAVVCIDRLSASLARAWASDLCAGIHRDEAGVVRVIYPSITAESLFLDSMPPLRRAARGNGIVTSALIRAMRRIAHSAGLRDTQAITSELSAIGEETRQSAMLEHEVERYCAEIDEAIKAVRSNNPNAAPEQLEASALPNSD